MRANIMHSKIYGCRGLMDRQSSSHRKCHRRIYKRGSYAAMHYATWLPQIIAYLDADLGLIGLQVDEAHTDQLCKGQAMQCVLGKCAVLGCDLGKQMIHFCPVSTAFISCIGTFLKS